MSDAAWATLRRQLHAGGGSPAWSPAEAGVARAESPRIQCAEVVEPPLRAIRCPAATPWDAPVGFLDGIQRTATLGSLGTDPVVAGRIAAGVRCRDDRVLTGVTRRSARLVVGRAAALHTLGPLPEGWRGVALDEETSPHPLALRDAAHAVIERARSALEIEVAREFRSRFPDAWLLIDGTLTLSPDLASDPRAIGLVKSHTTLPFMGEELNRYLTLPVGHRSSAYHPPTRAVTPIHAFGLRLWPTAGHDLFYGLLRVERAPTAATLADADQIAARLFAERVPLASDPRADRLLYGIHSVERWLGASL